MKEKEMVRLHEETIVRLQQNKSSKQTVTKDEELKMRCTCPTDQGCCTHDGDPC